MGEGGRGLATYLPLAIFIGIMALRMMRMKKARPLRLPLLWIMPVIVVLAVSLALAGMPPSGPGWLCLAAGLVVGGAIGAQRARLMHLHIEGDGERARVMMRQSPLAILLIVAVFVARRMILPAGGMASGHPAGNALLMMDATLGFALGMIVALRVVLWLRARDMVANHVFDA
ncbi:DUF1453 family protein [Novosphingobium guangzhouense]|uniref:DUF1453 domain-containing protein n=1 Tax=Novosphingobium guangzhouense TaxID=1850347 RepID=A0A2K2G1L7_9SPHN|nr:DUF1453 family protein [Novosphingobium guangzhouense]PNU04914.1 DUF1453 domain-containing protein [Novosphingobium guangzhouense]